MDNTWRAYAVAAITGMAATTTHDEIPVLCHMAAEIADEMVRREVEREAGDGRGSVPPTQAGLSCAALAFRNHAIQGEWLWQNNRKLFRA